MRKFTVRLKRIQYYDCEVEVEKTSQIEEAAIDYCIANSYTDDLIVTEKWEKISHLEETNGS